MHICFALTGDFFLNSRAKRQVSALSDCGFRITVVHLPAPNSPTTDYPAGDAVEFVAAATPHTSSGPARFMQIHKNVTRALNQVDSPVQCVHASDLFVLPALARLARNTSAPLSFDSRELYTHVSATSGRPWARLTWYTLQSIHLPKTTFTYAVSDGIADHLADKYGIPRPIVSWNVPTTRSRDSGPDIRSDLGLSRETFLAIHLGNLRRDRGAEFAVRALAKASDAHLAFIGDGPIKNDLAHLATEVGARTRVHFVPPVPPEDVTTYARSADIGLTLLADSCLNHRFALPNKLFEYIGAGVPIVASDLPEIRRVISDHRVGMCVEPMDVEALTAALSQLGDSRSLRRQLSENCRHAAKTLNWSSMKDAFVSPFVDALAK